MHGAIPGALEIQYAAGIACGYSWKIALRELKPRPVIEALDRLVADPVEVE